MKWALPPDPIMDQSPRAGWTGCPPHAPHFRSISHDHLLTQDLHPGHVCLGSLQPGAPEQVHLQVGAAAPGWAAFHHRRRFQFSLPGHEPSGPGQRRPWSLHGQEADL